MVLVCSGFPVHTYCLPVGGRGRVGNSWHVLRLAMAGRLVLQSQLPGWHGILINKQAWGNAWLAWVNKALPSCQVNGVGCHCIEASQCPNSWSCLAWLAMAVWAKAAAATWLGVVQSVQFSLGSWEPQGLPGAGPQPVCLSTCLARLGVVCSWLASRVGGLGSVGFQLGWLTGWPGWAGQSVHQTCSALTSHHSWVGNWWWSEVGFGLVSSFRPLIILLPSHHTILRLAQYNWKSGSAPAPQWPL